jgi:large subunit ribosomal protein L29
MAKEKINFVEMSDAELQAELVSRQNEYQQMKFDHAVKGLSNPMEIRDARRNVARILTEGRSRELAAMSPDELAMRTKLRARRRRNR